jgi:exonuclease SbcC
MSIKSIEINNFRTHRNTKLEFAKGINALIGLPDSGKTNIIRFINWVLKNRPLGFKFHSDFTEDITSGNIVFDEGNIIELEKNKKAIYKVNGEVLKAIGTGDVPDMVSQIANMTDLNIQCQLDKPFLICESPSEVAKVFNRITKLEKVDEAISLLTTDINSENKKLKIIEGQELELRQQIEDLGNIEEINSLNDDIQNNQKEINDIENKIEDIEDLISLVNSYNDEIDKLSIIDNANIDYEVIIVINNSIINLCGRIEGLEDLIDEIESKNKDIEVFGKNIKSSEDDLSEITVLINDEDKFGKEIDSLSVFITTYNNSEEQFEDKKLELKELMKEYGQFLNTIKICPFCSECKEPIKNHNLVDILEEYKL